MVEMVMGDGMGQRRRDLPCWRNRHSGGGGGRRGVLVNYDGSIIRLTV